MALFVYYNYLVKCRFILNRLLSRFLKPRYKAVSAGTLWRGEEANFLKSTARKGCKQAKQPRARLLFPPRSRWLAVSLSHALFLSIRSRTQAVGRDSAACSYFSPSNKIPTTFGPILDSASRIHNVTGTYSYVCPSTHALIVQPTATRRPRARLVALQSVI